MRPWMLVLAGAIVVLLVIPWRARRPPRVDPEPPASALLPSEPVAPEAQPEEPAAPPAEPAEAPEQPAPAREPSPTPEAPKPAAEPAGPTAPANIPPPEAAGPIDALRDAYEGDGAGSGDAAAERAIRELFGSTPELPVDAMKDIDCGARVCRVELWWSEQQPLVYMALAMTASTKHSHHVAVVPGEDLNLDGELPLTVYVLRAGAEVGELLGTPTQLGAAAEDH